jgi:hypothetical protein
MPSTLYCLSVAMIVLSVLSVILPLRMIVPRALSLSTSFIFLFFCSGDLIAFGMFNYFFSVLNFMVVENMYSHSIL